jgi:crotonobetainyl-CoA:carnitine CoA-transferase CaiB-like acyl-CoA transferase
MSGACDGLRVIDFSTWMAGPLATMLLADNGADVIKVEPPEGDPARNQPAFQTWNRGKRSVALDLKTDAGQQRALELVENADAVVTSYRPGVAERLGIGYEQVHAANPKAIFATINGYGEEGAFAHLKGYEALVCAKFGRMMMFEQIADRDGPGYPAVPCASYSAAMLTVQGILAALHKRTSTGKGQKVSVSLLASLIPYDLILWIGHQLREQEPEAEGQTANMYLQQLMGRRQQLGAENADESKTYNPREVHRPSFRVPRPNYLTAVTKDGVWLQFANTIDHLCFAQMQALDLIHVYEDERFAKLPAVGDEADSEALWEIVLERVRTKTYAEWTAIFDQYDNVAVERIRWPRESVEHRQVLHNGNVVDVPGLDGQQTKQIGPLVRFSDHTATIGDPAPKLDEHANATFAGEPVSTNGGKPQTGNGPLAGVTIVDFSQWIAAPYSTGVLANMGARVIRVEVPGGDFSRFSTDGLLSFPMTQGKESLALDLKKAEGQAVAHKLIEQADMVLHNFRPGVAERLGIDYETCRRLNPRALYLNAASYGDSGPDCRRPAFYAIAAANGGNQMRQAGEGHPRPDSEALPIDDLKNEAWRLLKAAEWNADPIAALGSATAMLLGLHARDKSGSGQELLTSMLCSNMYANTDELIAYDGIPEAPRVDTNLYGLGARYRLYEAKEGWVFLACPQENEWEAFCQAVERPDLVAKTEDALADEIAAIFGARTADEWERVLSEHDVPLVAVEMRDPGKFCLEDETMREQGHMVEVDSPVYGTYRRHGALQKFSDDDLTFGPWEPLGGHTRSILTELGFSEQEIETLIDSEVVEAWVPA